MYTEGMNQRRSMLEALFVLGAIWKKPDLLAQYMSADAHRLLNIHRKIKQLSPEIQDSLSPELSPDVVDARIAELAHSTKGTSALSAFEYAKEADLLNYYLTDYVFASEASHHAAKDLERQIELNANGAIDGFSWGPEQEPATKLLWQSIEYILMAIGATESIFELGAASSLTDFIAKMSSLSAADST
jgi:hypothetical protein